MRLQECAAQLLRPRCTTRDCLRTLLSRLVQSRHSSWLFMRLKIGNTDTVFPGATGSVHSKITTNSVLCLQTYGKLCILQVKSTLHMPTQLIQQHKAASTPTAQDHTKVEYSLFTRSAHSLQQWIPLLYHCFRFAIHTCSCTAPNKEVWQVCQAIVANFPNILKTKSCVILHQPSMLVVCKETATC